MPTHNVQHVKPQTLRQQIAAARKHYANWICSLLNEQPPEPAEIPGYTSRGFMCKCCGDVVMRPNEHTCSAETKVERHD